MPIIKVPATSANLGPGFDCLGIALDLYDTFTVTKAERKDILHNVEEKYCTPDNLFLQAYHKGAEKLGYSDYVEAEFACDIPISRGLGSSAAMIISGLLAANALHEKKLTKDEIFQLACDMEGHPDNAAPALAGGFCAAMHGTAWTMTKLPLDPSFIFTALVPDFAVETKKARAILPDSYPRKEAAANIGHAIFLAKAPKQIPMGICLSPVPVPPVCLFPQDRFPNRHKTKSVPAQTLPGKSIPCTVTEMEAESYEL